MEILLIDIFDKPHGIIIFQLLAATRFTIYLSLVAFSGGGIVASMITFLTISHRPMVRKFAQAYIWFLQSIPLLMLLFLTGLGVPRLLGLDVNPWTAASISLVLFTSAYLAEVWRGGHRRSTIGAMGSRFCAKYRFCLDPEKDNPAAGHSVWTGANRWFFGANHQRNFLGLYHRL